MKRKRVGDHQEIAVSFNRVHCLDLGGRLAPGDRLSVKFKPGSTLMITGDRFSLREISGDGILRLFGEGIVPETAFCGRIRIFINNVPAVVGRLAGAWVFIVLTVPVRWHEVIPDRSWARLARDGSEIEYTDKRPTLPAPDEEAPLL